MGKFGNPQTWASLTFGMGLTAASILSAMLFSAGIGFGFNFNPLSLLGMWAVVLLVLPVAGLALRLLIPTVFDVARNKAMLGLTMMALVSLHVGLMLRFA